MLGPGLGRARASPKYCSRTVVVFEAPFYDAGRASTDIGFICEVGYNEVRMPLCTPATAVCVANILEQHMLLN